MSPENMQWHAHLRAILHDPAYRAENRATGPDIVTWLQGIVRRLLQQFWPHSSLTVAAHTLSYVVTGVVLVLLVVLLSRLRGAKRTRSIDPAASSRGSGPRTVTDLLAEADARLSEGAAQEAVGLLFAAVVLHVSDTAGLRIASDKTNGDYVRDVLRSNHPQAAAFQAIARMCDELLYRSAYDRTALMTMREVAWQMTTQGEATA